MAEGRETYTLHLAATRAGWYTLAWPKWHNLPAHWTFTLFDHETGETIDLRSAPAYRFAVQATAAAGKNPAFSLHAALSAGEASRFTLRVTDTTRFDPDEASPAAVPTLLKLNPNYPNPFNPVTTIRYGVPEQTFVRLVVFDILGREVATLVSRTQAAGWHHVTWDAADRPSGVYLYRLEVGTQVRTRKMLLLK